MEFVRTRGDGMEFNILVPSKKIEIVNYADAKMVSSVRFEHVKEYRSFSLRKITPSGRIINVVPKLMERKQKKNSFVHSREPKFIPYEPFKAAVTPIVRKRVKKKKNNIGKFSKNDIDVQVLASQVSSLASAELLDGRPVGSTPCIVENDTQIVTLSDYEKLKTEIVTLRDSNSQLEKQLKFQTQVNAELKTLLVAAVGEDLEARVQLLTEDKLQLARALLNSAQRLSTHREQVEWLAGHCEVWRSKFLASSLMVDELARWKTVLTKNSSELRDCVERLLEEHSLIDVRASAVWRCLCDMADYAGVETHPPDALDVVSFMDACEALSRDLSRKITGTETSAFRRSKGLATVTRAERVAREVLTKLNGLAGKPDSVYGLSHPSPVPSHCARCENKLHEL